MNKVSNHIKNVLHGFFLTMGLTIAEPSTILPLMVRYFGGSSILVGLFATLLRGGAIVVQLFAAFKSQRYTRMLPYLRIVFIFRFFIWLFIGICINLFGKNYPDFTLFCIGLGLFLFSFSAGFGAIYFKDIIAKIFTHKFRGKTMAYRQFFSALGGLISGAIAAFILERYKAPYSFGYLFILSSFIMSFGYIAFATIDEPEKREIPLEEKSFEKFLKNSLKTLKNDKDLQIQISTFLFAYGYLISLPFIILQAKETINLSGIAIGTLITSQMVGAMLSNFIWGILCSRGYNRLTAIISIIMNIVAISLAFFSSNIYLYMVIFFLIGGAMDGNRISSSNLILILAPPKFRPTYVALQANIVSFGIFFSILGGLILHFSNYNILYSITILTLFLALFLASKL